MEDRILEGGRMELQKTAEKEDGKLVRIEEKEDLGLAMSANKEC